MPHTLSPTWQAVILAGSGGAQLHPLNSDGTPKVLLPVGNRPLLSFPLRTLAEAGVRDVSILCEGEPAASAVQAWLASSEAAGLGLRPEVIRVPEETSPVEALRSIRERLRADDLVILSGDVVTECKPGQAPRNVDYVGLRGRDEIVYFLRSPERARHLRLPARVLEASPAVQVRSDLADMHVYAVRTAALLAVLAARADLHHLGEHVVPFMVRQRSRRAPLALDGGEPPRRGTGPPPASGEREWRCTAFVAPEGAYCRRASSIESYADVNRDVISPDHAARLLREAPNTKYDNYIHPSTQLGSKATVGAGSMVGADGVLGDKVSVKRSVIGAGCTIGAGAKIINSILMNGVTVESGCHLHNTIICSKAWIGADASLRDCQARRGGKRPKGFLARYGSKLAVVGMLMLLGVVAWQHSHRRKLHEHLKLKDEHIQFMAATADQAQRDLHETTQTATTKAAEVDYLRKTVDRLRAELTAQVTKVSEVTQASEAKERDLGAQIKTLDDRLRAEMARCAAAATDYDAKLAAAIAERQAVENRAVAAETHAAAAEARVPAQGTGVPGLATNPVAGGGQNTAGQASAQGAKEAEQQPPVAQQRVGRQALLGAGPNVPRPGQGAASDTLHAQLRHHHRLSMLEQAIGHEHQEEQGEEQNPFKPLA
ncbi:hypothetical protein QBZ16_001528 [Prototheca wickerhamii]|uniref:Translation initiation factor eIF2B subunit gamma n=1 Tax=Prototheca wickerhamii TaxID=3111 RepID=A0AAD9IGD8_PROWI|nr:hypothetical protein QBZ16_001528 [Prototheca wickerhamii]